MLMFVTCIKVIKEHFAMGSELIASVTFVHFENLYVGPASHQLNWNSCYLLPTAHFTAAKPLRTSNLTYNREKTYAFHFASRGPY